MTWLRALWAHVALFAICRQAPQTIAEMRKASFAKLAWRTPTRTYEADPKKLRGGRVIGKVRNLADWSERHDRPRRIA